MPQFAAMLEPDVARADERRAVSDLIAATRLDYHRVKAPSTTGDIERFRDQQVANPSGVEAPTVVILDLTDWRPMVSDLVKLVVPLARDINAGSRGPLALVVCTKDPAAREVLEALATTKALPMFVAPSPDQLGQAEPLGRLTETARKTLDVMQRLGGRVTVSSFAAATGLAPPAANNRLAGIAHQGYIHRVARPGGAGALYLDPRVATPANLAPAAPLEPALQRELELFAAVQGRPVEELLVAAQAEHTHAHGAPAESLAQAWAAYRERHAGELSERLRWAQQLLADPDRAAVEMSGMSDEDLAELRREFG
jgi:hypothetical protein